MLSLTLALLGEACAHLPPRPDAQEVDALVIEGTRRLSAGDLKAKIVTGESSWVPWWFPLLGHTAWFDAGAWQGDLRRLVRVYEANGFYQARVLTQAVTPAREGHVRLSVTVHEGEPALVASLTLAGLEGLEPADRAAVVADLPLALHQAFTEAQWTAIKALLVSRLKALGYASAAVSGEALVDAAATRVDVTLNAVPGTRFHFGLVSIEAEPGARVPASLIADVASSEVKAGEWSSVKALQATQVRVLAMGVFAGVKVSPGEPDEGAGTLPVVIDVHEAPFNSARLGLGVGGDLFRQEARVSGEYVNRNLGLARLFVPDSELDRLTLKGKLGWAFLPTVWDVAAANPTSKNGPIALVGVQYEVPRLLHVPTLTLQTSLELSRMIDAAFSYYGSELKAGVAWRPRNDLTIFPSLNFDAYLLDVPVSVRDNVPAAALGCPPGAPCLVSFVDVTAELDRRDSRLEPKEGYYLGLSVQGGVAQTTSLKPYLRIIPEARGFLSFGKEKRVTLAGKLRAGTLVSTDENTPIVARFFSGGSSMRGFNARRLSPQVAVSRRVVVTDPTCRCQVVGYDANDGETLPVGGNGLLEASLELRWNVWGDLVLAVFNDWGLVTAAPLGPKTDLGRSLYAAVGLGARYLTPVGPIRVDIGVRLPFIGQALELQTAGVNAFKSSPGCFFGTFAPPPSAQATAQPYGGSPDSLCNFHLSIGEAF
jgi:translocation and assembly module TamA